MDDFFRGLSIGGNDIVKIVIIEVFFHIEKRITGGFIIL